MPVSRCSRALASWPGGLEEERRVRDLQPFSFGRIGHGLVQHGGHRVTARRHIALARGAEIEVRECVQVVPDGAGREPQPLAGTCGITAVGRRVPERVRPLLDVFHTDVPEASWSRLAIRLVLEEGDRGVKETPILSQPPVGHTAGLLLLHENG